MQLRSTGKARFTLIELLVVVAIVTILISMLQPAIHKTLESGRRLNCQNNLKQVGIGNNIHVDDFGDLAPGKIQRGTSNGVYAVWTGSVPKHADYDRFESHGILGYLGYVDPKNFYCPSWIDNDNLNWFFAYNSFGYIGDKKIGGWPEREITKGGWSPKDLDYLWIQTQYHYRQGINAGGGKLRSPSIIKDSPVEAIMADSFSSPTRGIQQHHKDGYNVLYIDGGVSFAYDEEYTVDNFNGGKSYHSGGIGFRKQEKVYLNQFAR